MTRAPELNLATLDEASGISIAGIAERDDLGRSVSSAGDINGDGVADIILGAAEKSYIVFGGTTAFNSDIDLNELNGLNGFTIFNSDINGSRGLGDAVSSAGDVNGDGIDDIILGAPEANNGVDSLAGRSYVIFGKREAFDTQFDLNTLDGQTGFAINGIDRPDYAGAAVSSAGDINGDGFDDVLIGAPNVDPNGSNFGIRIGEGYVVFGKPNGFEASIELDTLDGTNGVTLKGISPGGTRFFRTGAAVSDAGDINGDGLDDFVISAPTINVGDTRQAGQTYVVFGDGAGFNASFNLAELNGDNGFTLDGFENYDRSGTALSNAGDINGDGLDDLIIGSSRSGSFRGPGNSYVIFGSTAGFGPRLSLDTLNGQNGFTLVGAAAEDGTGFSVSGAGDFNGDGLNDLLVGAFRSSANGTPNVGRSYVVFGSSDDFEARIELDTLDGNNGFAINGVEANSALGSAVSGAGDINNDGFDDLLIGAPNTDVNGKSRAGKSYVIFGGDAGSVNFINGSSGNDELIGTNGPDTINGQGGKDTLSGRGSNDTLNGDAGADTLNGGAGNDVLNGGISKDLLNGDNGNDRLSGDAGNDTLNGGRGRDILNGGRGNDVLNGDNGNDTLTGDFGNDVLNGGNGGDILSGGKGNDLLTGGGGRDLFVLTPREGADTITDFSSQDRIGLVRGSINLLDLSFAGNDIIFNPRNEVLVTLTGVDTTTLGNVFVFV